MILINGNKVNGWLNLVLSSYQNDNLLIVVNLFYDLIKTKSIWCIFMQSNYKDS